MRYKILIVDDAYINRELLKEILRDDYDILEAENGKEALEIIEKEAENINAVLLDLIMPVMDGFEVLERMQSKKILDKIPVLVISGETRMQIEKKCFDYGVSDFIGRPYKTALVQKRVENMVKQYVYKNQLEDKVADQTNVLRKAYEKLQQQAKMLEKRNQDMIDMLGTIVEYRNLESGEHIQRVKGYTRILAEDFARNYPEYELTPDMIHNDIVNIGLHFFHKDVRLYAASCSEV